MKFIHKVFCAIVLISLISFVANLANADGPPKVNINTAGPALLQTLPGVGPRIAEDILKYRKHQPFEKPSDIMNIKGINPGLFMWIKDRIEVHDKAKADGPPPRVNINTAGPALLQTLPGIGPKKTKAIIKYRRHQPFKKPSDIMNIKGIDSGLFMRIKDRIEVHDKAKADGPPPRVNINTAGPALLQTLPGIGPKKTKAIIKYRRHRPFERPSDIMNIKGIGPEIFKRIKDRIKVHDKAKADGPPPRVNINTAGPALLETLPGIGPKKAKAIIKYRKNHGKFKKPAGIMNVKGINPELFKRIKDRIKVHG